MLQYRRRNSIEKPKQQQEDKSVVTPLLIYCKWSYASDYYINLETLNSSLLSFNQEYIPFYLRILNETSSRVVEAFLKQYQISKSSLHSIFQSLKVDGFKLKALL